MVSRRRHLQAIGGALVTAVAGCLGAVSDPDLRVRNFASVTREVTVVVSRTAGTSVLDERFRLPAKKESWREGVFPEPGRYQVTATLDDGTRARAIWPVDRLPLRGGFDVEIEPLSGLRLGRYRPRE